MPLLTLHMTAVRFSRQNRLVGNGLPRLPRGQTVPAVVTDCLTCELQILRQFIFFTYDPSESIMAVFVFYGYWGRAGCKVFAFFTSYDRVCAAFSVKTAPI